MYTAKVFNTNPIHLIISSFIIPVYLLNRTGIPMDFHHNTGDLVKPYRVSDHQFITDHEPTAGGWKASRIKDAGLKNTYDCQQTKFK